MKTQNRRLKMAGLLGATLALGGFVHNAHAESQFKGAQAKKAHYEAIFQIDSDAQGTMKKNAQ